MLTIHDAQKLAWKIADEKGFHEGRSADGRDDTLLRLCLVHTEISEAAQGVKRHWGGTLSQSLRDAFVEELADAVLRILDLAESVGVDLQSAVEAKMQKNGDRPRLYGTPSEENAR